MKKIEINIKDIVSFMIMVVICILSVFLGLVIVGNNAESFNDIIIETVAYSGTNHTGELNVFWSILFLGIPLLLFLNYLINRKKIDKNKEQSSKKIIGIELVLSVANIMLYLVSQNFNPILVLLAILVFVDYLILPNKEIEGLVLSIITYYFLLSLQTVYNNRGGTLVLNSTILSIITFAVNIILVTIERKKKILNKALLIMQIFIPFNLVMYICQRYTYNEEIMYLDLPVIAKALALIAVLAMPLFSIIILFKKWKKADSLDIKQVILVTTCMVIFAINSVSIDTKLSVPEDLHHTAEEVISYQQIIGKGQGAYTEYSPVSGLFPVFIGGVLELFGGNITAFNLAHSAFMCIFAMLTMYVLSKHLDKCQCLIVAMLFCFPSYDRTVFILVSLLILSLPNLIKKRNLWLQIWLWICFLGGIYYPSFGGAVLVGTLPLCLVQIIKLVKNDLKSELRSWKFYVGWIICLTPLVISIPMLANMAKHILIYSSQTNLADGISVFGQTVPEGFLPYLSNIRYIRVIIYYGMRYAIPITAVWLLTLICFKTIKKGKIKECITSESFLIIVSAIITLMVSYASTIVRNDPGGIVSRPTYIIVPIVGIFLFVIIKKYLKENYATYILIGIISGLTLVLGNSPVQKLDKLFRYSYQMSDSYELITEDLSNSYPRLGNGFILKDDITMFKGYKDRAYKLLEYDNNLKFLAWGKLGVYYTLDLTTVGQPSLYAAKDYKTHEEIINAIKAQKPVIGLDLSTSVLNYYLYNWLLTTDEYVFDKNYDAFLPKELFEKIYGKEANPTDKREISLYATDVGRVSNSLGKSMSSIEKVMDKVEIGTKDIKYIKVDDTNSKYNIKFDKKVDANSVDFIYIDFDIDGNIYDTNESKISKIFKKQYYNDGIYVISNWGDNKKDKLLSILGNGKLLIPLGTNVNWLLNDHDEISLDIKNTDKKMNIKNVQLYKLKTIK